MTEPERDQLDEVIAPSDLALEVNDISFFYQSEDWIIKDLSLSVRKSSVFAILGPNGCGKTTLLKIILGLLRPSRGFIKTSYDLALVPQLFQVVFSYTALDMVLMGRARKIGLFSRPSRHDIALAYEALGLFHVEDLAERPFQDLSGGQRQLVMLARALVAEADILVLDEPTSALDLKNQGLILEWMSWLSRDKGLTVIVTTHLPQHALCVADKALLMKNRDHYYIGSVKEILSEENLFQLYGIPLKMVSFDYQGQTINSLVPIFRV
jgi:iron complex transport system ATP-binding protein